MRWDLYCDNCGNRGRKRDVESFVFQTSGGYFLQLRTSENHLFLPDLPRTEQDSLGRPSSNVSRKASRNNPWTWREASCDCTYRPRNARRGNRATCREEGRKMRRWWPCGNKLIKTALGLGALKLERLPIPRDSLGWGPASAPRQQVRHHHSRSSTSLLYISTPFQLGSLPHTFIYHPIFPPLAHFPSASLLYSQSESPNYKMTAILVVLL